MEQNLKHARSAGKPGPSWLGSAGKRSKVVEAGWLALTLVLFMIMGPFAGPVALYALLSLPPEQRGETEPELLSDSVRFQFR